MWCVDNVENVTEYGNVVLTKSFRFYQSFKSGGRGLCNVLCRTKKKGYEKDDFGSSAVTNDRFELM